MANVFQTLKKLFSSDVVVRRIGKGKFRVIDAYNTQAMGMLATNYLTGKYSSLYSISINNIDAGDSLNRRFGKCQISNSKYRH